MSPAAAAFPAMLTRRYHWLTDSPACRGRTDPVTAPRSRDGEALDDLQAVCAGQLAEQGHVPDRVLPLVSRVAVQFSGSYMTHL